VPGGLHVGQHAGAGLGTIGHELRGVARLYGKAVDGRRIAKGRLPLRRDARHRHAAARDRGAGRKVLHLAVSGPASAAQRHLAKQVVQRAARIGEQHDDGEPAHAHVGPHIVAQQDAQAKACNEQQMQCKKQPSHAVSIAGALRTGLGGRDVSRRQTSSCARPASPQAMNRNSMNPPMLGFNDSAHPHSRNFSAA